MKTTDENIQCFVGMSVFSFVFWGHSSAGRAPALQAGGQRFDPACLHHTMSGDDSEGVTPVPIPNTEVKPFSADGTWAYALGE
jgi:hypothetical protein